MKSRQDGESETNKIINKGKYLNLKNYSELSL